MSNFKVYLIGFVGNCYLSFVFVNFSILFGCLSCEFVIIVASLKKEIKYMGIAASCLAGKQL